MKHEVFSDRFAVPDNLLDGISPSKLADKVATLSNAVPIGIDRFVNVEKFGFEVRFKIGQYYRNKDGDWVYGNRGITLTENEWISLLKAVPKINQLACDVVKNK